MNNQLVRVLVVDDSALMRKLIPQMIERDPEVQVVGTAMDGSFGLRKIEELRPDVVTLDLEMPRMDGMEALKQITRLYNVPVIVVSAHSTAGATATFKALNLGAFDFIPKPRDAAQGNLEQISKELVGKIKAAARTSMRSVRLAAAIDTQPITRPPHKALKKQRSRANIVVAIGVSTGGPNALQYMLPQLPDDFPAGILIVQHMPVGFTDAFARRLDECCSIDVKEAQSGDMILAGRALICPGNRHLKIRRMPLGDVAVLSDEEHVSGHRPSADVLFRSVASEFGPRAIGLIMTGMGDDGAAGLSALHQTGALTIAQDEASSVVWGMPKAAIERGAAERVLPLDSIANTLIAQCRAAEARSVRFGATS